MVSFDYAAGDGTHAELCSRRNKLLPKLRERLPDNQPSRNHWMKVQELASAAMDEQLAERRVSRTEGVSQRPVMLSC